MPNKETRERLTEFIGPIRFTPTDKEALEQMAQRNERTVFGEIRLAVRDRLKKAK